MQDLSRITGDPVILKPKAKGGREFVLRGASFEDVGLLQAELLKKKRKDIIDAAALLFEHLTPHERQVTIEKVRKEAQAIAYVTFAETMEWVLTEEGTITFLWILLNSQHPNEFTRQDIFSMFLSGEFDPEDAAKLITSLGGSIQGNATGQRQHSPTTLASEAGGMPTGSLRHRQKRAGSGSRRRKQKS